jgi:hypothetical protein
MVHDTRIYEKDGQRVTVWNVTFQMSLEVLKTTRRR